MNMPDPTAKRIHYDRLEKFVHAAGVASGLEDDRATLLAGLLATNDLRGVSSHGSNQINQYSRLMRSGAINPKPEVTTVRESGVSLLLDGDGGLGYFPAYEGTQRISAMAEKSGIAVLVTRNHGHFGAAGIYARIPLDRGLITFVTSGHQLKLDEGKSIYSAAGGSPMAFGVPSDNGRHLVVDFGCMHDLYASDPFRGAVSKLTPGLVLRSIGLGEICQSVGGFLSGLTLDQDHPAWSRTGANQGAFLFAFKIELFADRAQFEAEVHRYVDTIRSLAPLPGFEVSRAAGDIELEREIEYRRDGVPISSDTLERFETLSHELSIPPLEA